MFLPATFNLGVVGSPTRVEFDDSLTFPTIQVFENESDFGIYTDAPQHTIVHAKNTNKLYVWDGSDWNYYKTEN